MTGHGHIGKWMSGSLGAGAILIALCTYWALSWEVEGTWQGIQLSDDGRYVVYPYGPLSDEGATWPWQRSACRVTLNETNELVQISVRYCRVTPLVSGPRPRARLRTPLKSRDVYDGASTDEKKATLIGDDHGRKVLVTDESAANSD